MANENHVPRYKIDEDVRDDWVHYNFALYKSRLGLFGRTVWTRVEGSDDIEKLKAHHANLIKLPIYL